MGRILILLMLPTAAYLWWRYLKGAPPDVRRKRMTYGLVGGLLLVLVFASLRSGSVGGAAVGGVGLAFLKYLPSLLAKYLAYKARKYVSGEPSSVGGARPKRGQMTRTEALEILGLGEGADREQIMQRYKTLMKSNHPDRGGSSYLAARINQARDTLLGGNE